MAAAFLRLAAFAAANEPASVDHLGAWNCVLFGNPALGDERVLLRFDPTGATSIARASAETAYRAWAPVSGWSVSDGILAFADPRTGREFQGDLTRSSLGGTWRSRTLVGAWWCSAAAADVLAGLPAAESASATLEPGLYLPPLLPMVMATPTYPREAIRAAKEGRAVVCFVVDAEGHVLEPEVIELSDEVFRAPSLDSLSRSRYGGWENEKLLRPGCRTFIYRLDAVN